MKVNYLQSLVMLLSVVLLATSCKVNKPGSSTTVAMPISSEDVNPEKDSALAIYRGSATRTNDILHTKLDVSFNWKKQYLIGKASIKVKPYFYPTKQLILDAKGMEIKGVSLLDTSKTKTPLSYTYVNDSIIIALNKTYTNEQIYTVYIDYVAKPNELEDKGGSSAITSDKGLYFINPLGEEEGKPQQIWTQGETEASSVWFPTIDQPNERMTQEIYITVNNKYTTLSNGELVFSMENGDSTRTDYWSMELPHAPYLAMMAVGEFEIVKDTAWRGRPINYYVEKKYAPYAKNIFANTPEMLEFYSNLLGVEYVWNKYSQIAVRDFVSGAMENTTAALFGDFVQRTDKELLDKNYEYIVAHELFHEWFGDLVTCESWSNLPLNESFATYGEYLWEEYKYGLDAADYHSEKSRLGYIAESKGKQENLIRFHYEHRMNMFDGHSYNKGGQILHMLRKVVGDDAFFASLKLYLEENKYTAVEIHNLRLAFEEVTGQDLNWFFNQWFLSSGHPELSIQYSYDSVNKKQSVRILQEQVLENTPLFTMPIKIDIYEEDKTTRYPVLLKKQNQLFEFDVAAKPLLVNVDAEKMLLCEKSEDKSVSEWAYQYNNAPLYLDRKEALVGLLKTPSDSIASKTVVTALNDKMWSLRKFAIDSLTKLSGGFNDEIKASLISLVNDDPHSHVRAAAIKHLSKSFNDSSFISLYNFGLYDPSFKVQAASMMAITRTDSVRGLSLAKKFEAEENVQMLSAVAAVYVRYGNADNNEFFVNSVGKFKHYAKIHFAQYYSLYLIRINDKALMESGIALLEKMANKEGEREIIVHYVNKAIASLKDKLAPPATESE